MDTIENINIKYISFSLNVRDSINDGIFLMKIHNVILFIEKYKFMNDIRIYNFRLIN